ncbi:glycosyltransferase family 2 protein [bacterium]|nr:glycosyltransferase family 2 protein [bacterium]
MLSNKTISVVVPAYNEEKFIAKVITTMPDFVDKIIIVNDKSTDKTREIVEDMARSNEKIVLINHEKNQGNGQALVTGYLRALDLKIDVTVVMDGDGQMDPDDLINVVRPVVEGKVDYTKGNRLLADDVSKIMPKHRWLGNSLLTLLTKFATGYWHLIDPQCSYAAISFRSLKKIGIENMIQGYGYNADILNMLNIHGYRAIDVDVKPVYGDEQSKIKLWSYIPRICIILTRLFFRRLWKRYVVYDFHPLILFYLFAFFNIVFIILPLSIRFINGYLEQGFAPPTTLIILSFTILITFQSILFAIWMDMDYNRKIDR